MSSPSQKVVIPKGLVNPNETTIVEIPVNLQNVSTVIARAKQDWSFGVNREYDSTTQSPVPSPKVIKKRSYTRRSFPPLRPKHNVTGGFGTTFGGRPYEEESMSDETYQRLYNPKPPRAPRTPNVPGYRSFYDDVHVQSSLQDISYEEGPLYADLCRPKGTSTPPMSSTPGRTPPSMQKYLSVSPQSEMSSYESYGTAGYSTNHPSGASSAYQTANPPRVCKTSVTTSTPTEIKTTEYSEESWVDDTMQPSGPQAPARMSAPPAGKMTHGDLMNSLGELESTELQKMMGDLSNFQQARRKLVFDASSLDSAADVSKKLLHGKCCIIQ